MNKLGIAIKSTLMGSGEPYKINGGSWDKKVVDIRDVLRHVPSLATDPQRSVVFFSFSESGCYITVARCYPNREGDNIAGWIFVPADIRISGEELAETVETVRELIFRTELPERHHLEDLFNKAYPLKVASSLYNQSPKKGRFAKKDITPAVSMATILNYLYQPYYSEYQAVFIEEKPDEIKDAVSLSGMPLNNFTTVLPPDEGMLRRQGIEVRFAKNGEPFSCPMMVPVGSTIKLIASRKGFESFTFPFKAEADGKQCIVPNYNWTRKITKSDFIVLDPTGRRVHSGFTILINNQPLGDALYLSEPELATARLKIQYEGQTNPIEGNLVELPLTLSTGGGTGKGAKGVEWWIRLSDGSRGKVTVEGPEVKSFKSPLKGYEVDDDRLVYRSNAWTQRLIGFGAAILLGGIVVGILAICGVFGSGEKDPEKEIASQANQVSAIKEPAPRTAEEQAAAELLEKAAIAYLDSADQWKKSEMDANAKLAGLFDDLNTFNFEQIYDYWAKRFNGSTRFSEVVEKINVWIESGDKPEAKTTSGTYNEEGDEIINVANYIKFISKENPAESQIPITAGNDKTPTKNEKQSSTDDDIPLKDYQPDKNTTKKPDGDNKKEVSQGEAMNV